MLVNRAKNVVREVVARPARCGPSYPLACQAIISNH